MLERKVIITNVRAREILDSRGNPTVEVDVHGNNGTWARAAVPSGASTGSKEAKELRDGDKTRYLGKGVLRAVANANDFLADAVIGKLITDQRRIDETMIALDGTGHLLSNMGANAILGISMATARLAAQNARISLYQHIANLHGNTSGKFVMPTPMMNILNGGAHADSNVDIQEFMIMPAGAPTFKEAVRYGAEVFHALKSILKKAGLNTGVGDEGGYAPNLKSNEQALDLVMEAISKAGFMPGLDIGLALDVATTDWVDKDGNYVFKDKSVRTSNWMIDWYKAMVSQYPIWSIEDGLGEDDWKGWLKLTQELGQQIQLVGDDLFVTQSHLLQRGIDNKIANAILVKVNQNGTVSGTLDAIRLAQLSGYSPVISHRSGETADTFLADLAAGTSAGQLKTGSLSRTDRVEKYNQLIRIEEKLGIYAEYDAGRSIRRRI